MNPYPLYTHPALKDFRQLLDWRAGETPDNIAFQYKDKSRVVSVTYAQFRKKTETLAAFFHAQGFRDAKIAVLGENSYPWILTYFAAVLSDNIIVPIDKELPTEDIISLLQRCGATALVYSPSYEDVAQTSQTSGTVEVAFSMAEFPTILENHCDPIPGVLDASTVCGHHLHLRHHRRPQGGHAHPEKPDDRHRCRVPKCLHRGKFHAHPSPPSCICLYHQRFGYAGLWRPHLH